MALETMMIGVFTSLDLVLFYIFFEAGLIPMFLIIGVWGGKRRVYASFKFFLYTLLGSLLMLLAILAMYYTAARPTSRRCCITTSESRLQTFLWLAFFASFAVKMPMWPVHTWLPDAHVEAPTAGSVILAGIMLKMGGYGFLRFSLPMFASASVTFTPLIFALSVIAIIYTSLVALAQEDMKKLIAYSSVAPYGLRHHGSLHAHPAGPRRRHLPDAEPWRGFRRAVPLRRRDLRPHAHARDRGLWRPRQPHADLCRLFHGLHPRQCRPAGHRRLRRRVHDHARCLHGQHLGRDLRRDRRDPVGRLCALSLPPRRVRRSWSSRR
ncbi:MAG: NADH-quinone oxidoreductase subunit M [Rhizomicrobium sp.]